MYSCPLRGLKLRQTAGGHPPEAGDTWVRHQEELFAWKGCKTAAFFFFKAQTAVISEREQMSSSMTR